MLLVLNQRLDKGNKYIDINYGYFNVYENIMLDIALIDGIEKCTEENDDIGLIFHIRDGKVEWIEKIT